MGFRSLFRYGVFLLPVLLLAGCNGEPLPPAADPARAKSALQTALDAWQKGENVESLKQRSPAIYFNEPQCNERNRLLKYEIESEEPNALSWRCRALLTVQTGDAKPKEIKANYLIDTGTAIVIVRDSMK